MNEEINIEFDLLLAGSGMGELECCKCPDENHLAYKTLLPREESVKDVNLSADNKILSRANKDMDF